MDFILSFICSPDNLRLAYPSCRLAVVFCDFYLILSSDFCSCFELYVLRVKVFPLVFGDVVFYAD